MHLLLISNGNGEDRIAVELARAWRQERPHDQIRALALVGAGHFYQEAQIELLPPRFSPPSQGFAYLHPSLLWQDIKAGLFRHLTESLSTLKQERNSIDYVLAVGDIVALIAAKHSQAPGSFVACALSDYYGLKASEQSTHKSSFDPIQIHLLKHLKYPTFARDTLTAHNLNTRGVEAYALGNPMLDAFARPNQLSPSERQTSVPVIGLLPGSHRDALHNLALILKQIQPLENRELSFQLVLAPQIKAEQIRQLLHTHHWQPSVESPHSSYTWTKKAFTLELIAHTEFKNILAQIDCVIGLSGTANEQAVAHGVPVISFASPGQQYTWAFGEAQQRLLGCGLTFLGDPHPDLICWQIKYLLTHLKSYRGATCQVARERFGLPGASVRIVQQIQRKLMI